MQEVSVLSLIENAWLEAYGGTGESTEYRFEKTRWNIEPYSISPLCNLASDILIIHRNAQSRWVSRLGKGLAVHP